MDLHNDDAEGPNCQPVSGHGVSLHLGTHLKSLSIIKEQAPNNNEHYVVEWKKGNTLATNEDGTLKEGHG